MTGPKSELVDEVVTISTDEKKAIQVYENLALGKFNDYWLVESKYLIQSKMDLNYDDEEGLINQRCLKQEHTKDA
jgi:hypothetical protein